MRYTLLFASSFFMVSAVALALLIAPDLVRDYKMRGEVFYVANKFEFEDVSCRGISSYFSLCHFSIRQSFDFQNKRTFDYLILGEQGRGKSQILKTRNGDITTDFGRRFLKQRIVSFVIVIAGLLLLMIMCILGLIFWGVRQKRRPRKQVRYDYGQLEHLANHIVVSDNPAEVWQNIMHGSDMEWVVFQNGTLVLCEEGEPNPEHTAWRALDELAHSRNSNGLVPAAVYANKDYAVWIVSYPGSPILNYVPLSNTLDDAAALRVAEEISYHDMYEKRVLYIERYAVRSY